MPIFLWKETGVWLHGQRGRKRLRFLHINITDSELDYLVVISRGRGFAQYGGYSFPTRLRYALSQEELTRRLYAPWPEKDEKAFVVGEEPLLSAPVKEPSFVLHDYEGPPEAVDASETGTRLLAIWQAQQAQMEAERA
jgi:hypothetical protein